MCLYPKLRTNKRYQSNKKNGGVIPPVFDERAKVIPMPCGNCMECRKQKSREWAVRLQEDIKTNTNGQYVTLTFSNESIKQLTEYQKTWTQKGSNAKFSIKIGEIDGYEKDNQIATVAVRLFVERWRKKYGKSVRHWLITELGHNGTENIHLHGIIWTDNWYDIGKIWKYGFVWDGYNKAGIRLNYVSARTVNYIIKYVHKIDKDHKLYKPVILTSDGIGANYTLTQNCKQNKYKGTETKETYRTRTGHEMNLPTYYRNKIYTDDEKERLWINKLDKNVRYINGIEIDISNGMETYYKTLDEERRKNKKLGYGDDEKNWNREVYERERRKVMYANRTKKQDVPDNLRKGGGKSPQSQIDDKNNTQYVENKTYEERWKHLT